MSIIKMEMRSHTNYYEDVFYPKTSTDMVVEETTGKVLKDTLSEQSAILTAMEASINSIPSTVQALTSSSFLKLQREIASLKLQNSIKDRVSSDSIFGYKADSGSFGIKRDDASFNGFNKNELGFTLRGEPTEVLHSYSSESIATSIGVASAGASNARRFSSLANGWTVFMVTMNTYVEFYVDRFDGLGFVRLCTVTLSDTHLGSYEYIEMACDGANIFVLVPKFGDTAITNVKLTLMKINVYDFPTTRSVADSTLQAITIDAGVLGSSYNGSHCFRFSVAVRNSNWVVAHATYNGSLPQSSACSYGITYGSVLSSGFNSNGTSYKNGVSSYNMTFAAAVRAGFTRNNSVFVAFANNDSNGRLCYQFYTNRFTASASPNPYVIPGFYLYSSYLSDYRMTGPCFISYDDTFFYDYYSDSFKLVLYGLGMNTSDSDSFHFMVGLHAYASRENATGMSSSHRLQAAIYSPNIFYGVYVAGETAYYATSDRKAFAKFTIDSSGSHLETIVPYKQNGRMSITQFHSNHGKRLPGTDVPPCFLLIYSNRVVIDGSYLETGAAITSENSTGTIKFTIPACSSFGLFVKLSGNAVLTGTVDGAALAFTRVGDEASYVRSYDTVAEHVVVLTLRRNSTTSPFDGRIVEIVGGYS